MRRIFVFASAMLLSAFASMTYALGFGEIQLQSALNQPLKAEIPLLAVKPAERDQVTVEIASNDTFQRFGITRPAVLDQIDTQILPGANNTRLRVTLNSRVAIQEPFLTFLLEANWPDGRAIREYTVLLDPPVYAPSVSAGIEQAAPEQSPAQPAPVSTPTSGPTPGPVVQYTPTTAPPDQAEQQRQQQPRQPSRQTSPEPSETRSQPAAVAQQPGRQYGPVEAKETLWSIALKMRSAPTITQDQMMLAIYQANPEAFDGNINLMRKGVLLDIPSANEISEINVLAAKEEIRDQARTYESAATSPTQVAAKKKSTANLKPKLKPKLKLEPATIEPDTAAPNTTNTTVAEEKPNLEPLAAATDSAAQAPADADEKGGKSSDQQLLGDQAGDDPTDSVAQPEEAPTQIANAGDAAAAQNQLDQQAQSAPADSATNTAAPGTATEGSQSTDPQTKDGLEQLLSNGENAADANQTSPTGETEGEQLSDATFAAANANAEQGQEPAPETTPAESSAAVSTASQTQAQTQQTQAQTPAQAAATDAAVVNDNAAGSDAFIPGESVADSGGAAAFITPQRLLYLLGAILLLVALLIAWNRRKQKSATSDFSFKVDQNNDKTSAGLAAAGAGMAAATQANRAPVSPNVDAPPVPLPTAVDVDELLSDADSHIAYELYDEALDALALGLAAHPGNSELRCKVLEVHHAAGDKYQFFAKLDEYFPIISSDHPQWPNVAQMAHELAPDDARFASMAAQTQVQAQAQDQAQVQESVQPQQPSSPDTNVAGSDDADGSADIADKPTVDEVTVPTETVASLDDPAPIDPAPIDSAPTNTVDEFEAFENTSSKSSSGITSSPLNLSDDAERNTSFNVTDWDAPVTKPANTKPAATSPDFATQTSEGASKDSIAVKEPTDTLASWADEASKTDNNLTGAATAAGLTAASISNKSEESTKEQEEPEDSFEFDLSDFDLPADEPAKPTAPSTGSEPQHMAQAPTQDVSADSLDFDISELELSDSSSDSGSSVFDSESFDASEPDKADTPTASQPLSQPLSETGSKPEDDAADDLDWPEGFGLDEIDSKDSEVSSAPESEPEPAPAKPAAPTEQPQVLDENRADLSIATAESIQKRQAEQSDDLRIEEISDNSNNPLGSDEPISDGSGGFGDDSSSDDIDDDEILTKLDLARAYIDMGEEDMAQSLLQDVKTQGNAEQQREAQTLLDRSA